MAKHVDETSGSAGKSKGTKKASATVRQTSRSSKGKAVSTKKSGAHASAKKSLSGKASAMLSGLEAVNVAWQAARYSENLSPQVQDAVGLIAEAMLSRYTAMFSAISDRDPDARQSRSRVLLDAVRKALDLELAALFLQRREDLILQHAALVPLLADAIGVALTDSTPGQGKAIARSMVRAWQDRLIPSAASSD